MVCCKNVLNQKPVKLETSHTVILPPMVSVPWFKEFSNFGTKYYNTLTTVFSKPNFNAALVHIKWRSHLTIIASIYWLRNISIAND